MGNPVGCKVGPTTDPAELVLLMEKLNPEKDGGKLILITRFGAKKVRELLPVIIRAVHAASFKEVVWECDPMHGNTTTSEGGLKTRAFDDILEELIQTFQVHREMG